MEYNRAIEKRDIYKIDKLNKLNNLNTYWDDVKKLTKRVNSCHSIRRWECLSDYRYYELMNEKGALSD